MVYFTDGQSLLVSKTLRHFEELLDNAPFFRINRKDLVNLKYIQSYTHHKKARVVLPGNLWLELSDTRKQEFLECFGVG
jgi:two-component system LytT family response regulator